MGTTLQDPELARLLLPIQDNDHVQGAADAPNTLVEYGDYECRACGELYQTIRQLQREFDSKLRIVFRHYPLSGIHHEAQMAAEAAEAAGAQGKFWEIHELLFEHQNALSMKDLTKYAGQLSLDVKRFRGELKERVYEEVVREDFRHGVQNGVFSTPGLFWNGVRHPGPWDFESLRAQLEQEMETSNQETS